MGRDDIIWTLIAVFVPFSLASVGGGPSIFAGVQHQIVDVYGWVSAREFLDFFAISRAAPGPSSMMVTLIRWHVDGWAGALVATLALFVPSSVLCYVVGRVWNVCRGRRWHTALEMGLAPVAAGLIITGVVAVAHLSDAGLSWWLVVVISAATLLLRPKTHPLLILAGGGLLFGVASRLGSRWSGIL